MRKDVGQDVRRRRPVVDDEIAGPQGEPQVPNDRVVWLSESSR